MKSNTGNDRPLTTPQLAVLETLLNGNGHFVSADPVDYECAEGGHETGERRVCNCRAGWHAEEVVWDEDYNDPMLYYINTRATKHLIEKGLLVWSMRRQRGWITKQGRTAYQATRTEAPKWDVINRVTGCGDGHDEWVKGCDVCWDALVSNSEELIDMAADELIATEKLN